MRLKVKQICSIILIAVLLSLLLPVSYAAEESEGRVIFSESFESYPVGTADLSGYGGGAKGNEWKVVEENDTGNKYYMMHVNTASDMHLDKTLSEAVSGRFIIQMDLYFEDFGDVMKQIQIRDSAGREAVLVRFFPDGTITYANNNVITGYTTEKYYQIAVAVNTETKTMDIYINGKKRAVDVQLEDTGFSDLSMMRVHMTRVGGESVMRIDNLSVYTGTQLKSAEEINGSTDVRPALTEDMVLQDVTAMYMNKTNVMVKNQKGHISENKAITPVWQNEVAMVPLRFFAQSLGAKLEWEQTTLTAEISYGENHLRFMVGENYALLNGAEQALQQPVTMRNDSTYIPLKDVCSMLGLYCFSDESGLILYGEKQFDLSWENDIALLRKIAEAFIYEDVEGSEIVRMIQNKNPNHTHPRMMMSDERFRAIRENLRSSDPDPVYQKILDRIVQQSDLFLTQKATGYEIRDGIRLLYVSQEIRQKVLTLAVTYQLTLDERYAERAWLEMYNAACFVDWHPYHFLDTGEMTAALAFGYDWLYNWLDEGQRKIIREAIVENGFKPLIDDYDDNPRERTWNWRGGNPVNNWRFIAGGGVAIGAIAIADELEGEDLNMCERILSQSLLDIRPALSLFAPAGAYPEGLGYWGYAMQYFTTHIGSLMSSAGSDFGYTDVPGIRKTTDFVYALNGSTSVFNYGDAEYTTSLIRPQVMFFADRFGNYSAATPRIKKILGGDIEIEDLLYYKPEFNEGNNLRIRAWYDAVGKLIACRTSLEDSELSSEGLDVSGAVYSKMYLLSSGENLTPLSKAVDVSLDAKLSSAQTELDAYLENSEVFAARSGWTRNDTYVAMQCGDNFADHGHYDMGVFVMDAMGENFFSELGADSYNLPGYESDAYRCRAEGHNTIVINPDETPGQVYRSTCLIDRHESKPQGAFAISDITAAYADSAKSMKRGIKLDNYRRTVTVQDEVRLKAPSDFWWFAHTKADIQLSEDKRSAYLTINGKTLLAEIVNGEGLEFSVMDPKPLASSPQVVGQNPNAGFHKLAIHATDCESLDFAVVFNNYDADYDKDNLSYEYVALDQWSIPDGDDPAPYAKVNGISINGKALEGFSPDIYEYNISVEDKSMLGQERTIEVQSDHQFTISEAAGAETVYITVKGENGTYTKSYVLNFEIASNTNEPSGKQQIKPVSVKASAVPQAENSPENTMDGDLNTRWSCQGLCWIEYDLGKVYDLNSISLAFLESDIRTAQFSIELSEDGKNYVSYFDGDSIRTKGFENHRFFGAKARYVRINASGYDGNRENWNSITEVKLYQE